MNTLKAIREGAMLSLLLVAMALCRGKIFFAALLLAMFALVLVAVVVQVVRQNTAQWLSSSTSNQGVTP